MSEIATPARTGASLARGRSKQDYRTPKEFLDAVSIRFGPIGWDLAASAENRVVPRFYTKEDDALTPGLIWRSLAPGLPLWLNPPFDDIRPWASKCRVEAAMGAKILMLTPASVGTNWFAQHVFERAMVLFLSPRLTFVGAHDPYPKDLMLSCFGYVPGFECWKWK